MILIVAHHFVINSGLSSDGAPLKVDFSSSNSIFLTILGAWGKTGINCFLMITGYYMCISKITLRKFLKLLLQIYFYRLVIYAIFLFTGYEIFSLQRIVKLIMPFWGITDDFVSCFICFWLTIPFLTVMVHHLTKRQHQLMLLLFLVIYTVFGSIPTFDISFNYITWFGIVFLIASYIRLNPTPIFESRKLWGWIMVISIVLCVGSILGLRLFIGPQAGMGYSFVGECNRVFAVTIAVSSFLWFKNMTITNSKLINSFGAGTFGVLLIHANSSVMRTWLWKDTIDVVGHYSLPFGSLVLFSIGIVIVVFFVCNLIDQLRIATLEKWFFQWFDQKISAQANSFIKRITS